MRFDSDSADFVVEPFLEELGPIIGRSDSVAYFEKGELRADPLGPGTPTLLAWFEPVDDRDLADALEAEGLLLYEPPPSLTGLCFHNDGSLGWRRVEADGVFVVDERGWHRMIAGASRKPRQPKTAADRALIVAARALIHLAPDTQATVEEVQAISGVRESTVRAARPGGDPETSRRKNRAVGPWLDNLGLRAPLPTDQAPGEEPPLPAPPPRPSRRRGRKESALRPLGGPRSMKKK